MNNDHMSLGDSGLWGQEGHHERDQWSSVLGTVSSEIKFPGTVPTQSQTICCSLEQAEGMGRKRGLFQCAPSHLTLSSQHVVPEGMVPAPFNPKQRAQVHLKRVSSSFVLLN